MAGMVMMKMMGMGGCAWDGEGHEKKIPSCELLLSCCAGRERRGRRE
jgi:hypothetical protein